MTPKTKRVKVWMEYEARSEIEVVVPYNWELNTFQDLTDDMLQELDDGIVEVTPIDWGMNES